MRRTTKIAAAAVAILLTAAGTACTKKNVEPAPAPGGTQSTAAGNANFKIAFVPKLQGIPYFEAMNEGGKDAAAKLGGTWLYQGPTTADAAAQADVVGTFIQQKVDALFIAHGVHGEEIGALTPGNLAALFAKKGVSARAAMGALAW